MARPDLFKDTEKELWKKFDELFKDDWRAVLFTTEPNREVPPPTGFVNAGVDKDMKELLGKYNALKLYVTGVEEENRKLNDQVEGCKNLHTLDRYNTFSKTELKSILSSIVTMINRVIAAL